MGNSNSNQYRPIIRRARYSHLTVAGLGLWDHGAVALVVQGDTPTEILEVISTSNWKRTSACLVSSLAAICLLYTTHNLNVSSA